MNLHLHLRGDPFGVNSEITRGHRARQKVDASCVVLRRLGASFVKIPTAEGVARADGHIVVDVVARDLGCIRTSDFVGGLALADEYYLVIDAIVIPLGITVYTRATVTRTLFCAQGLVQYVPLDIYPFCNRIIILVARGFDDSILPIVLVSLPEGPVASGVHLHVEGALDAVPFGRLGRVVPTLVTIELAVYRHRLHKGANRATILSMVPARIALHIHRPCAGDIRTILGSNLLVQILLPRSIRATLAVTVLFFSASRLCPTIRGITLAVICPVRPFACAPIIIVLVFFFSAGVRRRVLIETDAVHLAVVVDVHNCGAVASNLLVVDAGGLEALVRGAGAHVSRLTSGARLRLGLHVGVLHLVTGGLVEVLVIPVGVLLPVDDCVIDLTSRPVCVNGRGTLEHRVCRHLITTGSGSEPAVEVEASADRHGGAIDGAVLAHLCRGDGGAALGVERHPHAVDHFGLCSHIVIDNGLRSEITIVDLPADEFLASGNLVLGARRLDLLGAQRLSLGYRFRSDNATTLVDESHSAGLSEFGCGNNLHGVVFPSLFGRHDYLVRGINETLRRELPALEDLAIGVGDEGELYRLTIGQKLGMSERDATHLKYDLHYRVAVDAARLIDLIGQLGLKSRQLLYCCWALSIRLRWSTDLDRLLVLELRHNCNHDQGFRHLVGFDDVGTVGLRGEIHILSANSSNCLDLRSFGGVH